MPARPSVIFSGIADSIQIESTHILFVQPSQTAPESGFISFSCGTKQYKHSTFARKDRLLRSIRWILFSQAERKVYVCTIELPKRGLCFALLAGLLNEWAGIWTGENQMQGEPKTISLPNTCLLLYE